MTESAQTPSARTLVAPSGFLLSPILYGMTVFVSAFLVFQVQPLIGKYILPGFGSSAATWTTTLLFFQLALFGGYAYAHFSSSLLGRKRQIQLHLALLALSALSLPIIPMMDGVVMALTDPVARILALLTLTVGIPYFLLASTSSLLQRWYAAARPGKSPYRLYALSNVGSLLGLVTYPFAVEPLVTMERQAWLWSAGYLVFACLCASLALGHLRHLRARVHDVSEPLAGNSLPSMRTGGVWLALSALPSALLVATTSRMSEDIPAVPFLFVVSLGTYLVTFVVAFDAKRWYRRSVFVPAMLFASAAACYALYNSSELSLGMALAAFVLCLFFSAMCCHGELSARKPAPEMLTLFFLWVAAGGALGGLFSAWLAPQLFVDYWEYEISLLGSLLLVLGLVIPRGLTAISRWLNVAWIERSAQPLRILLPLTIGGLYTAIIFLPQLQGGEGLIERSRSFYGTLKVVQASPGTNDDGLELMNGRIVHGLQLPSRRSNWTTSYYGAGSGVGRAILGHANHGRDDREFRLGIVGLGVGTLAVYANDRSKFSSRGQPVPDYVMFYEIDPQVSQLADTRFTFLSDARLRGVNLNIAMGDARLVMEQQLAAKASQRFDVLAVDAFTGDAIPTHLLTLEAFRVYLDHLDDDGIIAFHTSNRFLDLGRVVLGLAREHGMEFRLVEDAGDRYGHTSSQWALVTNNQTFLSSVSLPFSTSGEEIDDPLLWSDDFNSLMSVVRSSVFSFGPSEAAPAINYGEDAERR
jgi:hypothetical protein